jgi:acetyl esterase/lipase
MATVGEWQLSTQSRHLPPLTFITNLRSGGVASAGGAPTYVAMMKTSFASAFLALAACSPPNLLSSLNKFVPGDTGAHRLAKGVSFAPDRGLKLDVWSPPRADHKLPVVIFFYGGGWVGGSRGGYAFGGSAYAGQGFVTVVPDYRLVPTARFPAFIDDGALAVKWTRDNIARFGGDPDRIALAGHSAGSYNAAMLALDPHFLRDVGVPPNTIKGAALLSGPYDFYPFTEQRGRDALGSWSRPTDTQPINFVTPSAPPMLLATGGADEIVNPRNSQALAAKLKAAGIPVELKIYPGKSHVDLAKSFSRLFRSTTPALADSAAFLHRVLGS